MMKSYNIALIGCGRMGLAHIEDIVNIENVKFTYVCDLSLERAQAVQQKYGVAHCVTDYMDCIRSPEVDIVIIATLPASHLSILKECLIHNKHVLCEKPIAHTIEAGEEFVKLVKSNPDTKVLVGHILRHHAVYKKVAEMLHSGAVGRPMVFRMSQNHHTMDWPRYLGVLNEVSPLVDCGVHYVDVMQWFSNAKVLDTNAIGTRTEFDLPKNAFNYGLATFHFTDGSIGYYEAGYSNTIASSNIKEIFGPTGRIRIVYAHDRHEHQEEGDLIEYYRFPEKTYELINIPAKRKPTGEQLRHLLSMIEIGIPAIPPIDDVINSFSAMLKAEEIIKQANDRRSI